MATKLLSSWDFPGKDTGVGYHFLLQGDLTNPGIEHLSLELAGRFFTSEPLGKPQQWEKTGQLSMLRGQASMSVKSVSGFFSL